MRKSLFPFLLIFFASVQPLFSQTKTDSIFVIRLGNFVNAQFDDFTGAREVGFVFREVLNNYEAVSLGGYSQKINAQKALEQVQKKGFPDAYLQMEKYDAAAVVPAVQLGTFTAGKAPDWQKFFAAGEPVFVQQIDQQILVFRGGFSKEEDAKTAIADIRQAGFPNAFVKNVSSKILRPVTDFEAGVSPVKVMMIAEEPKAAAAETPPPALSTEVKKEASQPEPVKEKWVEKQPAEGAPVEKKEVAKAAPATPAISPNIKRTAALELQKVLKTVGVYSGSVDGYYGKGTADAFEKYSKTNRQWRKYAALAKNWMSFNEKDFYTDACSGCIDWDEIKVLLTVAAEMEAGEKTAYLPISAAFRSPDFMIATPLAADRKKEITAWNDNLWKSLGGWSMVDPMHAEIVTVLKAAFFQNAVRIEEYFISEDIRPDEAKWLALATLKTLVGEQLGRF